MNSQHINLVPAPSCHKKSGGSLSRAILDGKISKRCEICGLTGSLYNIVNHLFTGTTDDVL